MEDDMQMAVTSFEKGFDKGAGAPPALVRTKSVRNGGGGAGNETTVQKSSMGLNLKYGDIVSLQSDPSDRSEGSG